MRNVRTISLGKRQTTVVSSVDALLLLDFGGRMKLSLRRLTLFVGLLSLINFSQVAAQPVRLKAAYSVQSSWSLATWMAYEGGFFKKYGLDVDLVLIRATPIVTTAMISGEAPIGQLGGNGPIAAAVQGADTVNFATLVNLIPQSFVVTPDIKTPEDLKGKRYGVSRFGAISDVVV